MDTSSSCNRVEIESIIEDILLLYTANLMATLDKSFHQHINWGETAIKAAYKLGTDLGELFEDITFDIPCLDIAMEEGRDDQLLLTQKISNNVNFNKKVTSFSVGT